MAPQHQHHSVLLTISEWCEGAFCQTNLIVHITTNHLSTMIYAAVRYLLWVGLVLSLGACNSPNDPEPAETPKNTLNQEFTVKVFSKDDPGDLNALVTQNGYANNILDQNVHAALLELNPNNYDDFLPYLAVSRPTIEAMDGDRVAIRYEIRPEANWDDGTPITGDDVAFTLKAVKNPRVNSAPLRTFVEFVQDIEIDPTNPKKFTLYCKPYLLAEAATGTLSIFPAYFYDPQALLSEYTVADLSDDSRTEEMMKEQRLIDFAEDFNGNYSNEPDQIVGAGPYQVAEIQRGQFVRLERKKDWWGDQVDAAHINAYPTTLMYRVLADDNNAITALKEQELDVMNYIPEEKYLEIKENERINQHFNLYTPPGFAYRYIGINTKRPQLSDVRVRRALAHLIDKDYVANDLANGLATPVNSPVSTLKPHFNKNLPTVKFDVEKARQLLAEAGWADSDGDNVLDKMIDGKRESLRLRFIYGQGKQFYKDVAQILKDEAARVGIEIVLTPLEFSVMIERLQDRDYDLSCLAWGQGPLLDDFKQIWHTESDSRNGSNMVSFGNAETDQLIEQIRVTTDDTDGKRTQLYHRFQEIVAEQQPYVFLVAPKLCTAIHKRFTNAPALSMRPGHMVRLFQLDPNYKAE